MEATTTQPKIFLIDDQKIANFITKKMLSTVGFNENIEDFSDPIQAFEKLSESKPKILLLDLNMPVMNGWQFLQKMKEKKIDTKVIILTSSTSILDKEKAKDFKNVIDYYIKPFTKQKILQFQETCSSL